METLLNCLRSTYRMFVYIWQDFIIALERYPAYDRA